MTASDSAKATAVPTASLRTSLISPDCDGRNEQRMNAIFPTSQPDKREKSLFHRAICPQLQRTVNRARLTFEGDCR